jgi:hypothetical protein
MDITKHHRRALLSMLEDSQALKAQNRRILASESIEGDAAAGFEVEDFLHDQRIDAIKLALTNNELYNY